MYQYRDAILRRQANPDATYRRCIFLYKNIGSTSNKYIKKKIKKKKRIRKKFLRNSVTVKKSI
jgi:hypothetical protein